MPRCEFPVNFDVWWFRLPREGAAEFSLLPRVAPGKALVVIPRKGSPQNNVSFNRELEATLPKEIAGVHRGVRPRVR